MRLNWYVPEAIKVIGQIALCPRHITVHAWNVEMKLPTFSFYLMPCYQLS